MVSNTSQTNKIRQSKHNKMGRKRKNKLANQGSTRSQVELFGTEKPAESQQAA
jgi:hypothetical protein